MTRAAISLLLVLLCSPCWAAISGSNLTTAGDETDGSSYSTASVTPGANRLVLVWVASVVSAGTANEPTLSGNGLTYVSVATQTWTAAPTRRITLFRAMGASPSAGAVTIDFAAQTQLRCLWSVSEFTGVDTSGTNGSGAVKQSATNEATATSLTVTLAAFASTANGCAGGFWHSTDEAATAGGGFTEIAQVQLSSVLISEWRADNDTTVDASAATSSIWIGVAAEVAAARRAIAPIFLSQATP